MCTLTNTRLNAPMEKISYPIDLLVLLFALAELIESNVG